MEETTTNGAVTANPKQRERAERILDAAAELLLRWGYKRVTIEEIAKLAGVGTGTVYLHWKTKVALFQTLMLREAFSVWRELLAGFRADPHELYIHRLIQSSLLLVMRRPIARALFTGDVELLGKLVDDKRTIQIRTMATPTEFVALMRDLGLMRTDMDLHLQQYAFSVAVSGFYLANPWLPQEHPLSLEEQAQALGQMIRRAFEPDVLPSDDVLEMVIAPRLIPLFEEVCEAGEQLFVHSISI